MNSRQLLLLSAVVSLWCAPSAISAQYRGVSGTTLTSAPVKLLPEEARPPLATLPEGSEVQVLGPAEDGWYRIAFQDNYLWGDRIGYVRADHVRVAAPLRVNPPAAEAPSARGAGTPAASRNGLSGSSIAAAVAAGYRQKGLAQGLWLLDSGEMRTDRTAGGRTSSTRASVRVQIHTPLTWIQQLASEAARRGRSFGVENVTDEMTRPLMRITALGTAAGRPAPRHLVLRSAARDVVVQPLSKEAFSEHALTANGGSAVFDGLRVTFSLDAVRKLRASQGGGEFLVTVIEAGGVERNIRLSNAQLHELPM